MNKKRMDLLMIFISCIGIFSLFLITGCGQACIEIPKCGVSQDNNEGVDMGYVSLPMCGGCLTYEWGCNSCIWPQKCVVACASGEIGESYGQTDESNASGGIVSCDNVYYGSSCFVCGGIEQRDYAGVVYSPDAVGCYCGSTKCEDEYLLGYYNGCACASKNDNNNFAEVGSKIEDFTDALS